MKADGGSGSEVADTGEEDPGTAGVVGGSGSDEVDRDAAYSGNNCISKGGLTYG